MAFASLSQSDKNDLAVSLAVLLLNDSAAEITSSAITDVLAAAGVEGVETYYPALFAKILKGQNFDELLMKPGSGGGGGGGGGGGAAAPAAGEAKKEAKEEKKKEIGRASCRER